jgi:hypothetical protein
MKAWLSVWGVTDLSILARRAVLRTFRPRAVPVRPPSVRSQEHRPAARSPMARSIARAVRGASGDGDDLAAVAGDRQRPVPAIEAQVLDHGAGGLGDSQAVEREQGDQRMLGRRAEPGSDQQGAEFVTVQRDGVGLVVHSKACWATSSAAAGSPTIVIATPNTIR